MSVYIKGMELPTSCFYCPMREWHIIHGEKITSCRVAKTLITNEDERLPSCPLVPVPPHGDLIDKSGVDVLSWTEDPEKDFNDGVLFVLDKIDSLPVIIPAEGEDYEVPVEEGE